MCVCVYIYLYHAEGHAAVVRLCATLACVRQQTSVSVSIRQHTSEYVAYVSIRQHTPSYGGCAPLSSAFACATAVGARAVLRGVTVGANSRCLHAAHQQRSLHCLPCVSIRQHKSAYVSIRQHTLRISSARTVCQKSIRRRSASY